LPAQLQTFGAERAPLLIFDDFWDAAADLVERAAHAEFRAVGNFYPGVRAPAPQSYVEALVARIEGDVRDAFALGDLPLAGCQSNYSLVTATPDRLELKQTIPHFDTTDTHQLAVLHYLCAPDRGGTSFYRHRSTGFETITAARKEPYFRALARDLETIGLPPRDYISGDTPLFERTHRIDAVFNRLVVYRSINLHSGNIPRDFGFAMDARNGRLTLNTFLQFGAPL